MTLTPAEALELERLVGEQADDLEWLAKVERQFPLAVHTLWSNRNADCDQQRAVAGVMRAPKVGLVLGGWRSGKSEGLKQLTVAKALGGDHPAVRAWLAVNDLPADLIPDGPAQVYAIAPTSNDSLRFHRDDFDRLVGPFGSWYNRNGKGEAVLVVSVPGSKATGKIWFKAVDQGRKSFQGISIRWAWIDEEPLGDLGYGVYDELKARVADQSGQIGISMVPKEGITWVQEKLVGPEESGVEDEGARAFYLDALKNPHLPPDFGGLYKGMDADSVAVNRFGRFRSRSGAMYPLWAVGDGSREGPGHVCDEFPIPGDWLRFRGVDFGLVNPTCVLWGAVGDDDTLYIFDEYYKPNGESYDWHADNVAETEGWERVEDGWRRGERTWRVEAGWGDPSSLKGREAFASRNVGVAPANNDVIGGIDRVRERLRLRGDNRPRLKVFRRCRNLIREMGLYVKDDGRVGDFPKKENDHAPDALRYLCMGLHERGALLAFSR